MSTHLGARATYQRDGTVTIKFPFDREVVEALKFHVPSPYRAFDPEKKQWIVSLGWAQVAIDILRSTFGHVDVEQFTSDWAQPEPIRRTDPLYTELHLLPSAPPELVQAAYRVLAKTMHPDCGGDTSSRQRVNAAYEALRKCGAA